MTEGQADAMGTIVSFALHAARAPATVQGTCLTPQDRMTVSAWRDRARLAGFERMVIHDRDAGDALEVGNFLSVHRCGQAWSRWGFARAGRTIRAWCCLSGADIGQFDTLAEALAAVLEGSAAKPAAPANNLVRMIPRLGSAA